MKTGLFFSLIENTKFNLCYRYDNVILKDPTLKAFGSSPILLALNAESIRFYFIGIRQLADGKIESNNSERLDYYYCSSLLFELNFLDRLSSDDVDSLLKFGIFHKEEENFSPILDKEIYSLKYGGDDIECYRSLKEFSEYKKINIESKVGKGPDGNKFNYSTEVFLPDLLLDFLFDFLHSNVFHSNKHYNSLRGKILATPALKAILAKLEFQYYQKKVIISNPDSGTKIINSNILDDTKSAANNWLDVLLIEDKQFNQLMHPENSWFKTLEEEHRKVYKNQKLNSEYNIHLRYLSSDSIFWWLRRYAIKDAILLQWEKNLGFGNKIIFTTILYVLSLFFIVSIFCEAKADKVSPFYYFLEIISPILSALIISVLISFLTERLLNSLFNYIVLFYRNFRKLFRKDSTDDGENEKLYRQRKNTFFPIFKVAKLRIRLLLSSIAIWLYLHTDSRFWDLSFRIQTFDWLVLFTLFVITFVFTTSKLLRYFSFSSNDYSNLKKFVQPFLRALLIYVLGFAVSITIGIFISSKYAAFFLSKEGHLRDFYVDTIDKTKEENLNYTIWLDPVKSNSATSKFIQFNQETPIDTLAVIYNVMDPQKVLNEQLFNDLGHMYFKRRETNEIIGKVAYFIDFPSTKLIPFLRGYFQLKIIFFPQLLIYYSFFAVSIGIFIDLGFKKDPE